MIKEPIGNLDPRLWRVVGPHPFTGCWLFMGSLRADGYGTVGHHGYAHIEAYKATKGPVPEGCEVHHSCEVHNCVLHVHAVTHKYHMQSHKTKTHCDYGHLLDAVDNRGKKFCRTCSRIRRRAYLEKKRGAR